MGRRCSNGVYCVSVFQLKYHHHDLINHDRFVLLDVLKLNCLYYDDEISIEFTEALYTTLTHRENTLFKCKARIRALVTTLFFFFLNICFSVNFILYELLLDLH